MAEQAGDKTLDPTPHRRQEAREQGHVAKSQDLAAAAVLLAGLVVLWWNGERVTDFFGEYTKRQLSDSAWLQARPSDVAAHVRDMVLALGAALSPVLLALFATGVGTHLAQSGLLLLPEKLLPDFSRIDPLQGVGRMFSLQNFVRLFFGLCKIGIVGCVAWMRVRDETDDILALTALETPQLAAFALQLVYWTALYMAAALLLLALFDYFFQWWKHEQDLRMTVEEVREEMKNLIGDPQIIARRKQVQRQLAISRLSTAVPKADVVVTNPTELAVALQYDPTQMAAPVVIAKGAGQLAKRIRTIALEHGVPILERKPLAQLLYKEVEVNHPIPNQAFAAVAEVLAYVYRLKGKRPPQLNRG